MIRANRHDAVFIRKSTEGQDEGGQIANVNGMLKSEGVTVAKDFWFVGTVSRRKVKGNAEFSRLMELVEADKVGTVYVESQDRWGTADRPELFTLLGILREHDTRLYDLRAKKDLAERDLATEMLAFVNSIKSEKELQDLSYRSLRTRVANFKDNGSWPTGTHPFGYGKACYTAAGELMWVWQPTSRADGQLFYPDPKRSGRLIAGPIQKLPRKNKGQRERTVLVPSNNADHVGTVRMVFDLYARVGLSRRQISKRLNDEGRRFYTRPFTHAYVTQILTNPAYAGDTHFGKNQSGYYHTFDGEGLVVTADHGKLKGKRGAEKRIIKTDTHKALIDRKTWTTAQAKMATEQTRRQEASTSFAPRNPNYYLKQILVCGHCGKGMTARTESAPGTDKRQVVYVCSTYIAGRCSGQAVSCGYQRITHDDAERLLLGKIAERDIWPDEMPSLSARDNLRKRLERLGQEDEEARQQWYDWVEAGAKALIDYMRRTFDVDKATLARLNKAAMTFYRWGKLRPSQTDGLPVAAADFKAAVREAERAAVEHAKGMVDRLTAELTAYTKKWALADGEQANILKAEADRIEVELETWRPNAVPLSQRLAKLYAAEGERQAEYKQLRKEWPALAAREKGEAMRRLFTTVTLFWDRTFRPASPNPTRPRKTDRPGRYSYKLQTDKIQWAFTKCDLAGSW